EFAAALGFSLALGSAVITLYSVLNGVIQPVLGYVADRWHTRLISVGGLLMTAVGSSMLGLAPHYVILLALAMLGGMGTAVYHPQAAAMVVALAGRRRATVMSLYLMGGNVGLALGPLAASAVIVARGLHATWVALIPGIAGAVMLAYFAPRDWSQTARGTGPGLVAIIRRHWATLWRLFAVVITRSWAHYTLLALLPFYLRDLGVGTAEKGFIVTLITLAGAIGGVIGGYLADRWLSRRTVIVGSLAISSVFVLLLLHSEGWARYPWATLTGMTLLGSFAVLTVKGQELMPQNIGLASGFMLGLTISLGGLFVLPMGWIADNLLDVRTVIHAAVALPLVAAALARTLPE
ncbi:MAG: MFS transporter, partial [Dehalococcoidia bacterium]